MSPTVSAPSLGYATVVTLTPLTEIAATFEAGGGHRSLHLKSLSMLMALSMADWFLFATVGLKV